ncbi:MAG: dethiobiotin synthase [Fibrobacterales bacterium]
MAKTLFITGTDTEVGKTFASTYISAILQSLDEKVGYYKPIQCGPADACNQTFDSGDTGVVTYFLQDPPIKTHNSYRLKTPASPHLAFKNESVQFSLSQIISDYIALKGKYSTLVIEGAGGVNVPITLEPMPFFMADLIESLKSPAIIIARPGLGTLNHTLLTIEALTRKRIPVLGFLFSTPTTNFSEEPMHRDNAQTIAHISGAPFLGYIPYFNDALPPITQSSPLVKSLRKFVG